MIVDELLLALSCAAWFVLGLAVYRAFFMPRRWRKREAHLRLMFAEDLERQRHQVQQRPAQAVRSPQVDFRGRPVQTVLGALPDRLRTEAKVLEQWADDLEAERQQLALLWVKVGGGRGAP